MTLTDSQQDLLETAVRDGYFAVPRRTTLVSLADSRDISDVEASEQLREAVDQLVRAHLFDEANSG